MEVALFPSTTPRGRVLTEYLRLVFFLEGSNLQTEKLRTIEDIDIAVVRLSEAIKSATKRAIQPLF